MAKDKTILHLILKRKWWDMIASGKKKEEYRDMNLYWAVRLIDRKYHSYFNKDSLSARLACLCFRTTDNRLAFCKYESVCFHLGYSNNTMSFKINSILIKRSDECRQDWGAEPEKYYFVIRLGERVV